MYAELTAGYHVDPDRLVNGAIFDVDYSEMVVVKDIPFYSLCEHHLLPFFGSAARRLHPRGRVIGLSKIPRIVEMYARRLQVQERMTQQIADFLDERLAPQGVGVVVEANHLCAVMRGIRKPGTVMTTSRRAGPVPAPRPDARRVLQPPRAAARRARDRHRRDTGADGPHALHARGGQSQPVDGRVLRHPRRVRVRAGRRATRANSLALARGRRAHVRPTSAGSASRSSAIWFAGRPASRDRTFGYLRLEILAAVVNAVVLFGIAAFVLFEAWRRLVSPPDDRSPA